MERNRMNPLSAARCRARHGIVLVVVIAVFAMLALLAGTVFVLATTDLRMTAHFKRAGDAFFAADGGVHYVCTRIEQALAAGSLALEHAVETVDYQPPEGLNVDPVTQLVRIDGTECYFFRVTGHAYRARDIIDLTFRRASYFEMGLFGDDGVDLKAFGSVYSYDSGVTPNPVPDDSFGGAIVACNGEFVTRQDTFIDGSFQLGESESGTPGVWKETPEGGSIISGDAGEPGSRIDPDPLGAVGGELATEFVYYSDPANNNNSGVDPPIPSPQNRIRLGNGESLTLTSGSYYLSEITLNNGATLNIDASSGPVKIYLTGSMEAKEGSTLNYGGAPSDLSVYSNSDRSIILKHDGSFRGLIYAPYAAVEVRNSADFYGIAWADTLEVKNGGDIYLDVALMRQYPSDNILILAWKEVRG
ncbi:MAG: hypothetical protein JXR37_35415 [Kiritimatiellae bacterium]|nr:hypothetical protein [Kiritimatiellia bacterium]